MVTSISVESPTCIEVWMEGTDSVKREVLSFGIYRDPKTKMQAMVSAAVYPVTSELTPLPLDSDNYYALHPSYFCEIHDFAGFDPELFSTLDNESQSVLCYNKEPICLFTRHGILRNRGISFNTYPIHWIFIREDE